MKNNRDRLTLVFKKNTDYFLLKLLIQTKDHENSDRLLDNVENNDRMHRV
jgi:hypothetical protein